MEVNREMYSPLTTFNNSDTVHFQGVHQTIRANSIILSGESRAENMGIDEKVLSSLAFPEMHQRKGNVEKPYMHTCNWILELKEFEDWMDSSNGLLWIKGKPGAGKSTLMAFLYEQLIKTRTAESGITLEFFFSARGTELQRTPLGMLRSLLNQLYRQDPHIRPAVRQIYQDKCDAFGHSKQSWEWQQPELERILQEILVASAQTRPLIVFVDALDEAGQDVAQHLTRYFHQINECMAPISALGKLCISCRHYPGLTCVSGTEISVDEHNHDDIAAYIRDSLRLDHFFAPKTTDHQSWESVITYLLRSAKGVFQWIRLVVPLIEKKIQDGESPENVREYLRTVPGELREIYEYILRNVIEIDYRSHAYLLFQWVCLAERPLSATELRYAISAMHITTRPQIVRCENTPNFIKNDHQMKRQIRAWSGGLVEVVEEKIQAVHQSVIDYILSSGLILLVGLNDLTPKTSFNATELHNNQVRKCQSVIYYSCLNYLLTVNSEEWDIVKSRRIGERTESKFSFLKYAATHIFSHATKAAEYRTKDLQDEILLLRRIMPMWVACYERFRPLSDNCADPAITLLHVASWHNLSDIVRHLLSQGVTVDETDSNGNTALHYASRSGTTDIAQMLVNRGADMQTKNKERIDPFTLAAGNGQTAMVKYFLSKGLDVNESSGVFGNALHEASARGLKETVRILLDAGADANSLRGKYGTPLQTASCRGLAEIVQLLLDAGADVNTIGGQYGTALQAASYEGSARIVQLLLDAGADVNVIGGTYGTALQAASFRHRERTEEMQFLLDASRYDTFYSEEYATALQTVSFQGREWTEAMQLLLDATFEDIFSVGSFTPPDTAPFEESRSIVQLLLNAGADVNTVAGKYGTALQAASCKATPWGATELLIELLDGTSVDLNAALGDNSASLQALLSPATIGVVQQLLDAGADVNTIGGKYGTALQAASCQASTVLVQLLLDAGADVNTIGGKYGTALQAASSNGSTKTRQLLLDAGAIPSLPLGDSTFTHAAV